VRLAQLALEFFALAVRGLALADVHGHAEHADRLALIVGHDVAAPEQPEGLAVGPPEPVLDLEAAADLDRSGNRCFDADTVFRVDEREEVLVPRGDVRGQPVQSA